MAKQKLNIFARVRELEGWKAVAYSAALLERMIPNYALFCEVSEYEEAANLRACLDLIWESVKAPKSKFNVAVQLEKVELGTPDTHDFDTYGVYPAIDAAIGMAASLNLIGGDDPQGAVVVSKLSQGSVEAYLLASGEATDENVKEHPLMVFEIAVQDELLSCIEQATSPQQGAQTLKQVALEEGISNIGLDLA
jgi:uncharacterized protein YjaG (DUF416 family)